MVSQNLFIIFFFPTPLVIHVLLGPRTTVRSFVPSIFFFTKRSTIFLSLRISQRTIGFKSIILVVFIIIDVTYLCVFYITFKYLINTTKFFCWSQTSKDTLVKTFDRFLSQSVKRTKRTCLTRSPIGLSRFTKIFNEDDCLLFNFLNHIRVKRLRSL